jgi:hypothetical protein
MLQTTEGMSACLPTEGMSCEASWCRDALISFWSKPCKDLDNVFMISFFLTFVGGRSVKFDKRF